MDNNTAILAALFGGVLLATNMPSMAASLDPRTAREIRVLSRVLENRLRDGRQSLVQAPTRASALPS